jgi:hemoglobin
MSETLYERLGGEQGVEAVVDDFYDRVLADDSLQHHFEGVDTESLRDHQRAFLSMVAGGPDEYDGDDMRAAHAHLPITEAEFGDVAEHLDAALRENGVADSDREAVMAEVGGLEDAVLDR